MRRDDPFDTEAFWHGLMRSRSLPTARLHVHGRLGPWNYALFDWLQGDGEVADGASLGHAIGQALSRMHDVPVDGVGTVRSGAWESAGWGSFIEDNVQRFFSPRLKELSDERFPVSRVERSLDALVAQCHDIRVAPRLLHGDLGLDNVICSGGTLVGLIDPGWCIGGDPLLDVSYVLTLVSNASILDGFRAGYRGYADLDRPRLASYAAYHHAAKLLHWLDEGARERADAWADRLAHLVG